MLTHPLLGMTTMANVGEMRRKPKIPKSEKEDWQDILVPAQSTSNMRSEARDSPETTASVLFSSWISRSWQRSYVEQHGLATTRKGRSPFDL